MPKLIRDEQDRLILLTLRHRPMVTTRDLSRITGLHCKDVAERCFDFEMKHQLLSIEHVEEWDPARPCADCIVRATPKLRELRVSEMAATCWVLLAPTWTKEGYSTAVMGVYTEKPRSVVTLKYPGCHVIETQLFDNSEPGD